jgi:rhodanese-related sulfurtransferase
MKIAVSVHLYHLDMWERIQKYLENLDQEFQLLVNIPINELNGLPVDFDWVEYMEMYTDLKLKLKNNETVNLIDVRQPDEHLEFNIGGILLPLGQIQTMQIDEIESLKDEEVICYCRSGQRSMQAALMLETLGFKNVFNLVILNNLCILKIFKREVLIYPQRVSFVV